jgi:hypothetical protein
MGFRKAGCGNEKNEEIVRELPGRGTGSPPHQQGRTKGVWKGIAGSGKGGLEQ